jgi:hypothetical protein
VHFVQQRAFVQDFHLEAQTQVLDWPPMRCLVGGKLAHRPPEGGTTVNVGIGEGLKNHRFLYSPGTVG